MNSIPTLIVNLLSPFVVKFIPQIPSPPSPLPIKEETIVSEPMYLLSSWYGPYFDGRETANQEIFNKNDLTAAHPSLSFNTKLKVTYKDHSVIVRINDRGPYTGGRELDLSEAAAKAIGLDEVGVAVVKVEIVEQ